MVFYYGIPKFILDFIHFIQVIVIIFIYLNFSFLTLFHIIIYNL